MLITKYFFFFLPLTTASKCWVDHSGLNKPRSNKAYKFSFCICVVLCSRRKRKPCLEDHRSWMNIKFTGEMDARGALL